MANIDSGFSTDVIALGDLVLITAGSIDPSVGGYEAPVGSLYMGTSGSIYRKTGQMDTDWSLITAGGVTNHNDLLGIQGGATSGYYHLTGEQLTSVLSHLISTNNPHSTAVSNLVDAHITSPSNRQAMLYDAVNSKWVNSVPTTADLLISADRNFVSDAKLVVVNNTSGVNSGDQSDATLTFSDVTNNNVSVVKHGFVPKAPADSTKFLNGLTGSWENAVTTVSIVDANGISGVVTNQNTTPAITLSLGAITPASINSVVISGSSTPTLSVVGATQVSGNNSGDQSDATLAFTDIITNNASTVKHGFLPKLSGVAAQYLDGSGAWSTPSIITSIRSTYLNNSSQIYTNTATVPLTYDTIVRNDPNITISPIVVNTISGTKFTFAVGGWFAVWVECSVSYATNSAQTQTWDIFVNGVAAQSSRSQTSTRSSGDRAMVSINTQLQIPNGGTVYVGMSRSTASAVTTIASTSRITFIGG